MTILSKSAEQRQLKDYPSCPNQHKMYMTKPTQNLCDSCRHGKQTRANFKRKEQHSTSKPLELIHTDLCGPARVQSLQGEGYFMLFIDDFTKMVWVTFLKEKSEDFDKFKALVETESGLGYWGRFLL